GKPNHPRSHLAAGQVEQRGGSDSLGEPDPPGSRRRRRWGWGGRGGRARGDDDVAGPGGGGHAGRGPRDGEGPRGAALPGALRRAVDQASVVTVAGAIRMNTQPMRANIRPTPMTRTATPNAITEVKSADWSSEPLIE